MGTPLENFRHGIIDVDELGISPSLATAEIPLKLQRVHLHVLFLTSVAQFT